MSKEFSDVQVGEVDPLGPTEIEEIGLLLRIKNHLIPPDPQSTLNIGSRREFHRNLLLVEALPIGRL
jgi:hypothetical protein